MSRRERRQSSDAPSEERARLFVALELPSDVRDQLSRWTLATIAEIAGMRPVAPDHLHVTLCFLGWRSVGQIEAVADACQALAGARAPALTLVEPVWLPARRPRVLGVGLDDDRERLGALQSQLSDRLAAGGWYEPERRAYLPHVTVGRAGRQARVRPVALPALPALSFSGHRATLFRSRLSAGGARYEALASFALSTA